MRSTQVMNDFREVDHGIQCLISAFNGDAGALLVKALDACHPGVARQVQENFNAWIPGIRRDTYLACFSEHSSDDNEFGRLSMWRAYGGGAGVAFIFKCEPFFSEADFPAQSAPVRYLNHAGVKDELIELAGQISSQSEFVRTQQPDHVQNMLFEAFRFAAVATKHPAFKEEHEWRVVAMPSLRSSSSLPGCIETIGGIPQRVLKVPLRNNPAIGLDGLDLDEFISCVLIGSCEHGEVIWRALVEEMEDSGVTNAANRVRITGIPLRANQR